METTSPTESRVIGLVQGIVGRARAEALVAAVEIDAALLRPPSDTVSRAELAQALNLLLFDDLLRRVPAGALYVLDRVRRGEKVVHDHGAVRTVLGETGALPAGERALTRVLAPLGYEVGEVYPLDRLGMTGRAWRHRDFPETIAQFFVSELHVDRFSPRFGESAARVFGASRDPLPAATTAALEELAAAGSSPPRPHGASSPTSPAPSTARTRSRPSPTTSGSSRRAPRPPGSPPRGTPSTTPRTASPTWPPSPTRSSPSGAR